jgi:hypothetical protein
MYKSSDSVKESSIQKQKKNESRRTRRNLKNIIEGTMDTK